MLCIPLNVSRISYTCSVSSLELDGSSTSAVTDVVDLTCEGVVSDSVPTNCIVKEEGRFLHPRSHVHTRTQYTHTSAETH